jgi:hypothetical protein
MKNEILSIAGRNFIVINKVASGNGFIAQVRGKRGAIKTVCNYGKGWKVMGE